MPNQTTCGETRALVSVTSLDFGVPLDRTRCSLSCFLNFKDGVGEGVSQKGGCVVRKWQDH